MTIAEAIKQLERIRRRHGDDVRVLFDCPRCGAVLEPDVAKVEVQLVARIPASGIVN